MTILCAFMTLYDVFFTFPFSLVSMALQASQHRAMSMDERKRPYHSMKADQCQEPTEEEMEAFRLKRKRTEDPMADFLKR